MRELSFYLEPLSRFALAGLILVGIYFTARLLNNTALNLPFFKKDGRRAYVRPLVWLLWVLGLILALQQVGVHLELISSLILILVFMVCGTLGLVFSLSAYPFLHNVLTLHFVKGEMQTGSQVRVGDKEGRVISLNPMYLVLETSEGKACIPLGDLRKQSVTIIRHHDARE